MLKFAGANKGNYLYEQMIFPDRAYLYGDLLFETLLGEGENLPHGGLHFRRLERSASVLDMDLCGLNEEKFHTLIRDEIRRMGRQQAAEFWRIRFVLQRESGGYYLPVSDSTRYFLDVRPFAFPPMANSLNLGVYRHQTKAPGSLSNLKSGNALLYVMASKFAKSKGYDDAIILNTLGEPIEATSSNFFWMENKSWFTPPLSSGCIAGIGREVFMQKNQVEEKNCSLDQLLNAEKIILTNALILERPAHLSNLPD